MKTKIKFRILLSTGFVLWVLSLIGDSQGKIPESTYGMICSAILTILGIYFWIISYKEKRGFYPKFFKFYKETINSLKKNPFNMFFLMVKHLLKFYVFTLVFSMILIFIGFLTIGRSEPVKAVQNYCENNSEITKISGKIKHYGILRNVKSQWNSETGSSEVSLLFVSENGTFNVNSKLKKVKGTWIVESINIKNKNTGANNGYQKPQRLGFSFGKTSMSRKVVIYLLWSVLNPCGFR